MSKNKAVEISHRVGLNRIASKLGANSRSVRRELIKKYRNHFTKTEIASIKRLSVEEINNIIDSKVGKTK